MRYILTSAAIAAVTVSTALAQDSASVNATATIEKAVVPIAVTSVNALSFGTVYAPNGAHGDSECAYHLGSPNTTTGITEYENGASVATGANTRSGCNLTGTPQRAEFNIACQGNSQLSATVTWTTGGVTGVTFGGNGAYVADGGGLQQLAGDSSSATASGLVCEADGEILAHAGGALTLTKDAVAGSNVNVGTITLSASY